MVGSFAGTVSSGDDMNSREGGSLTERALRGVGWTWGGLAVMLLLQLAYTATMSRLLTPATFGLVAGAMIGLQFITYFSRFGLGSAVVQRDQLDSADVRVAQTLSVIFGLVAAGLAMLAAPLIAAVLKQPETITVMRWLSLGLVIAGFAAVPEALMRRAMRFRDLAISGVVSFVVGYLVVGIGGARAGWGVWSLVAATLTQVAIQAVLFTILARPSSLPSLERERAKKLLSFGGAVSVTGFLEFLQSSLDTLSVGRYLGSAPLGQYSRATYLSGLPVHLLANAVTRVLLPSLSKVQDQQERFSRGLVAGIGMLATVVMVPVAVTAAAAPALVPLVLGSGWDAAAAVLPIVAVAAGVGLLTVLPGVAVEAKGAVGRKLAVQAASLFVTVVLIVSVVQWGPSLERFAYAWLIGEIFRHVLYWLVLFRQIGAPVRLVVARYVAAASLAIAASIPFVVGVRLWDRLGILSLILCSLVGAVLAAGIWFMPAVRPLRLDVMGLLGVFRSGRANTAVAAALDEAE